MIALLRDVLARIVAAEEELAEGECGEATLILSDLEADVAGWLALGESEAA